jgi:hypothetical protein
VPLAIPAKLNACILDRTQRTVTWAQRHEQILNEASPALTQPGDQPRAGDQSRAGYQPQAGDQPRAGDVKVPPESRGDPCQGEGVFDGAGDAAGQPRDHQTLRSASTN